MSRRKARELALGALYAHEMSGNSIEAISEDMINPCDDDEKVKEFARILLKSSIQNKKEFDELISKKTHNWDFERIAVIDKLILRMAICEFLFFEDIPPKVSIDEAIEVAKQYSTERSGQFINGILDSILLDLNKQSIIKKKGRGLK